MDDPLPDDEARSAVMSLLQGPTGTKFAARSAGWTHDPRSTPLCKWTGIECDFYGAILKVDVGDAGVEGTLPTEVGALRKITHLYLRKNSYKGTIPTEILGLPLLEVLDASYNDLTGTLPSFVSEGLREMDFSHNRLTGSIWDDVGTSLPAAIKFDVSHNALSSTVPYSVSKMKSVDFLDLSYNRLTGTIPSDLDELKQLQGLFLNNNGLVGTIPPSLARCTKLVQLFLESNGLSGTIPAALADIPSLKDLFVDENKFTGTVPNDLCKLSLNDQFFQGDKAVPSRDGCTSVACPVDHQSLEGVAPCKPCGPQGFTPYLGHVGKCYNKNQRVILDRLYEATNGPMWDGISGWTISAVPVCDYEGVRCNRAGQVVNVTLKDAGLEGPVIPDLAFLSHLRVLDLSDNGLTGTVPSDLRFAPLETLDLSGNALVGPVPPLLCLEGDINDNGMGGSFSCQNVLCPVGTFNPEGSANVHDWTRRCKPCPGARYLGSKACDDPPPMSTFAENVQSALRTANEENPYLAAAALGSVAVIVALLVLVAKRFHWKNDIDPDFVEDDLGVNAGEDFGDDDYFSGSRASAPRGVAPPSVVDEGSEARRRAIFNSRASLAPGDVEAVARVDMVPDGVGERDGDPDSSVVAVRSDVTGLSSSETSFDEYNWNSRREDSLKGTPDWMKDRSS